MGESLDSVLEKCLEVCGARSPHDAVAVALHACLLADGFLCIATGDEVGAFYLEYKLSLLALCRISGKAWLLVHRPLPRRPTPLPTACLLAGTLQLMCMHSSTSMPDRGNWPWSR